jgi:tRNA pseudouridine38-40 synthase
MATQLTLRMGDGGDDRPVGRFRAVIAYRGTEFSGVAENRDVRTVAGELRAVLEPVVKRPVELALAGRTDAGVHARAQVISFDAPADLDTARIVKSVNGRLGPDIVMRQLEAAPDPDFHARFSARWRRYRYTVNDGPCADPLAAGVQWWTKWPLDLDRMRLAVDPLIGEHDFSSFCRRPAGDLAVSLVRRVTEARWSRTDDGLLRFEIQANAFCQQMVRSIVGLSVEVGRGHISAGSVRSILLARDRARAGQMAPAHGLVLWQVGYDDGYGAV